MRSPQSERKICLFWLSKNCAFNQADIDWVDKNFKYRQMNELTWTVAPWKLRSITLHPELLSPIGSETGERSEDLRRLSSPVRQLNMAKIVVQSSPSYCPPLPPPNTTGHFQVQNVLFLGYMMRIPIPPFLIPPFFNTAIFWPVSRVAVWGDYILI